CGSAIWRSLYAGDLSARPYGACQYATGRGGRERLLGSRDRGRERPRDASDPLRAGDSSPLALGSGITGFLLASPARSFARSPLVRDRRLQVLPGRQDLTYWGEFAIGPLSM